MATTRALALGALIALAPTVSLAAPRSKRPPKSAPAPAPVAPEADAAPEAPAEQTPAEKAAPLVAQARVAYQQGDFHEAAKLLAAAYEIDPEPSLIYNLARSYERLGELEQAVTQYRRYLEERPDVQDRSAIEATIATLMRQIEKANRKPIYKRRPMGIAPILTTAVGLATVGGGVAFGLKAKSRRKDAVDDPIQASAAEKLGEARDLARNANIMYAVGGAVTAAGVTWIIVRARSTIAVLPEADGQSVGATVSLRW